MTKRALAASVYWAGSFAPGQAQRKPRTFPFKDDVRPSVYIIELGGYGVFEPSYEGSKRYLLSFKPIVDINKEGDRVWQFFPNDAIGYDLFETANFHAGPAGNLSLQSRFHSPDIDFRLGKADVTLQGGVFAEYYPVENFRDARRSSARFDGQYWLRRQPYGRLYMEASGRLDINGRSSHSNCE